MPLQALAALLLMSSPAPTPQAIRDQARQLEGLDPPKGVAQPGDWLASQAEAGHPTAEQEWLPTTRSFDSARCQHCTRAFSPECGSMRRRLRW